MLRVGCERKSYCTIVAIIVSALMGVAIALSQISASITLTQIYFAIPLGVAIVYLAVTFLAAAIAGFRYRGSSAFDALIVGIIGTIVMGVICLLANIIADVLGAVLVGLLTVFFTLMLTSTVCVIRYFTGCGEQQIK